MATSYTYLALGDSYTIGEAVPIFESFPYQTVQMLRKAGTSFNAPEIVAKTGWTTDELQEGIASTQLLAGYDVVSLLIGVNNQYRGRYTDEYSIQFESLLKQALGFARNYPQQVFVLSIPDWGATPFAREKDTGAIAREIDAFNAVNASIAAKYEVNYLDITPGTREAAANPALVAADGLHPSGTDYERWATGLANLILSKIK